MARSALTPAQVIGLKYVREFETPATRDEVDRLVSYVATAARDLETDVQYTVCGAYRRGAAAVGDIVVVLTHPDYTLELQQGEIGQTRGGGRAAATAGAAKRRAAPGHVEGHGPRHGPGDLLARLVHKLHETGVLTDDFSFGHDVYMGVCQEPRHKLSDATLREEGCAMGPGSVGGASSGSGSGSSGGSGSGSASGRSSVPALGATKAASTQQQPTLTAFASTGTSASGGGRANASASDTATASPAAGTGTDTDRVVSATGWPDALAADVGAQRCAGVTGEEAAALDELRDREGTAVQGVATAKEVLAAAGGVGPEPGTAESTAAGVLAAGAPKVTNGNGGPPVEAAQPAASEAATSAGGPGVLPPSVAEALPLHRRITLRYVPANAYATAILDYTGPRDFNMRLR
jgi:hypothetical protein